MYSIVNFHVSTDYVCIDKNKFYNTICCESDLPSTIADLIFTLLLPCQMLPRKRRKGKEEKREKTFSKRNVAKIYMSKKKGSVPHF